MQQTEKHIYQIVIHDCAIMMFLPMMMIGIGNLVTELLGVFTADVFGEFTDAVFTMEPVIGLKSILILALCIFATVVIAPVFSMVGNFMMLRKALRHDNVVFSRFLDMDMQRVLLYDLGEIQYQLEDAPNELRIYWVRIIGQCIALPLGSMYFLFCAGRINLTLTAIMVIVSVLKIVISASVQKRIKDGDKKEQAFKATRSAFETEITRKPYIIKLWGLKLPLLNRIDDLFKTYYKETAITYIRTKILAKKLPPFSDVLASITLFVVSAVFVAQGRITAGELVTMLAYLPVAQTLLTSVSEIIEQYPLMRNAAKRVSKFYHYNEIDAGVEVSRFLSIKGNNIKYSYSDRLVLDNINISIHQGDKLRLVGENGSGKSTLIRILCGLLCDYDGSIYLNGIDMKSIDMKKWRQMIAYAPQTPYLFNATVKENIILGDTTISSKNFDTLMNGFGILSLAEKKISMSTELSGGEKQKISIVRALIHKSDILILDEPTNYLDNDSICFLRNCITNDARTIIIVTHNDLWDELIPMNITIRKCL